MESERKNQPIIYFIIFLVLTLTSNPVSAQNSKNINSVLWHIKDPTSKNVSYLLGTNHLFGAPWIRQFPALQDYIKDVDIFYCESYNMSNKDYLDEINKNQKLRTAKQLFGNDTTLVDDFFTNMGWVEQLILLHDYRMV